jgi:hypothetical protein
MPDKPTVLGGCQTTSALYFATNTLFRANSATHHIDEIIEVTDEVNDDTRPTRTSFARKDAHRVIVARALLNAARKLE